MSALTFLLLLISCGGQVLLCLSFGLSQVFCQTSPSPTPSPQGPRAPAGDVKGVGLSMKESGSKSCHLPFGALVSLLKTEKKPPPQKAFLKIGATVKHGLSFSM